MRGKHAPCKLCFYSSCSSGKDVLALFHCFQERDWGALLYSGAWTRLVYGVHQTLPSLAEVGLACVTNPSLCYSAWWIVVYATGITLNERRLDMVDLETTELITN